MEKKKTANKGAKTKPATKAQPKPAADSTDWSEQPERVIIIGEGKAGLEKGKEYEARKGSAKSLVESGKAKLKG